MKKFLTLISLVAIPLLSNVAKGNCKGQPNMKTALMKLNEAQTSLKKANPNKKGHRVKAIKQINKVKKQIQMGCQKANKKGKK